MLHKRRLGNPTLVGVGVAGAVLLLGACGGSANDASTDARAAESPAAAAQMPSGADQAPKVTESPIPVGAADAEGVITVGLDDPYTPTSTGTATDDYRCFLMDLGVSEDRMVTGVRFVPGNPAVVHHAIVYRVQPSQLAGALDRDDADPGQGWSCFGGPDLPRSNGSNDALSAIGGSPWLAAWAPGGREARFADGTGVSIEAGSHAVLQVHYNLLGGLGPDLTQVELRTEVDDGSRAPLQSVLLPAPVELPCGPGDSGPLCDREVAVADTIERFGGETLRTLWGLQVVCGGDLLQPKAGATQSCDHRATGDMRVYSGAGHMHLLGRTITVELNPDTPDAQTLVDIQAWDFDNQASTAMPEPVEVKKGDVLRVTCTHDVGLRQVLPALADMPARYVTWGEGTSDEMCLGILSVTPA